MVSANFIAATEGQVITLTGGADAQRVFAQTELPALLANPAITSVDGIPIEALRALGADAAFLAIRAQSEVRASTLRIAVDEAGLPLRTTDHYLLDTRTFLADVPGVTGAAADGAGVVMRNLSDFVPPDRILSHQEGLRHLEGIHSTLLARVDALDGASDPLLAGRLLGALNHVGSAVEVLDLAITAMRAKAAFDAGDTLTAQTILSEWALENAGAILAGRLASLLVAPLVATGPLGALVAVGLTLTATAAGSAYAEPVAHWIGNHILAVSDAFVDRLRNLFLQAENTGSPLILDLDGNGVGTLAEGPGAIHFDHDGNGFAERSGWVDPHDGLLVRDLNGDGLIETGAELFGNRTLLPDGRMAANGFEALRPLDGNHDGRIDLADPARAGLRVWRDANSNALVDAGELLSLEQAGVSSLNLHYVESTTLDAQGNAHRQVGSFLATDGTVRSLTDVWFALDRARTRHRGSRPVPAAIAALPDLPGMGNVPSLHQVLAADVSGLLQQRLQEWMNAGSGQRAALMEDIIFRWSGVQNLVSTTYGPDPQVNRRVVVLERWLGEPFREGVANPVPGSNAIQAIHTAFEALAKNLTEQLVLQVHVPGLLERIAVFRDLLTGAEILHAQAALDELALQLGSPPDFGRLVEITAALSRLGDQGQRILEALRSAAASRDGLLAASVRLVEGKEVFLGGASSAESLQGGSGSDWIDGRAGNDLLSANAGNDKLVGGTGNDTLQGGVGNDTYLISRGDGLDQLVDSDGTWGNVDVVVFTDVRSDEVTAVERVGNGLRLSYGSGDVLTMGSYFQSWTQRVEQWKFADGVVWDDTALRQRLTVIA